MCRAAAARAALHAAPAAALLLDEPAAALDAHAERALLAALAAVAPHTTIVTVAVTHYNPFISLNLLTFLNLSHDINLNLLFNHSNSLVLPHTSKIDKTT